MSLAKYIYLYIPIRLLVATILLNSFGFSKIFHGVGMQMTTNGSGMYYKPGMPINNNLQIIGDFGIQKTATSLRLTINEIAANIKKAIS